MGHSPSAGIDLYVLRNGMTPDNSPGRGLAWKSLRSWRINSQTFSDHSLQIGELLCARGINLFWALITSPDLFSEFPVCLGILQKIVRNGSKECGHSFATCDAVDSESALGD